MKLTTQVLTYSVSEAAETIGCGATSVYDLIKTGRLKARKLGQRTLILRDDLQAFLNTLPVMGEGDLPKVRTPDRRRKKT
jgi:excisionase family DNA binding protein